MEFTLDKILSILKGFKNLLFFIVILTLLIIIQFKNGKINKLTEEVLQKPITEYVYNTDTITVIDTLVEVKETIKYKDKILVKVNNVPIELTKADSAQIAEAYIALYTDYNSINKYDDILKDDSLAFVRLKEEVVRNNIHNREFIYKDRTPTIYTTNTTIKQNKTLSFVGGIGANIGKETNALSLGAGIITPSNRVYLFQYDPINKGFGGSIYFSIFNFKK